MIKKFYIKFALDFFVKFGVDGCCTNVYRFFFNFSNFSFNFDISFETKLVP